MESLLAHLQPLIKNDVYMQGNQTLLIKLGEEVLFNTNSRIIFVFTNETEFPLFNQDYFMNTNYLHFKTAENTLKRDHILR